LWSWKFIITVRKLPKKKTPAPSPPCFLAFMGGSNGNAILSWECIKFWNLLFLQWANQ
jgi:hypothetical protein